MNIFLLNNKFFKSAINWQNDFNWCGKDKMKSKQKFKIIKTINNLQTPLLLDPIYPGFIFNWIL